jgi:hypothetical protein
VSALSTMERSLGAKPPLKPNLSVVGDKEMEIMVDIGIRGTHHPPPQFREYGEILRAIAVKLKPVIRLG